MRKRLIASFVVLALGVGVVAFVARSALLTNTLRSDEREAVKLSSQVLAEMIEAKTELGEELDAEEIAAFIPPFQQAVVYWASGDVIVAPGEDFRGSEDPTASNDIWASAKMGGGYIVVSQDRAIVEATVFRRPMWIVSAFVLLVSLAAIAGAILGRTIANPFRQLAQAARALGRGRFDLNLPTSTIPEVQEISTALETSAKQLQQLMAQEQSFAEHASHVMRTPLTALRLELDELSLDPGLTPEARSAVERSVQRINSLDAVTGELLDLARKSTRLSESAMMAGELARSCAQRWADELAHHDRTVAISVEGDAATSYTPGPLEHLHELLLLDVLHRSRGPVRLAYHVGDGGMLRIGITAEAPVRTRGVERGPGTTYQQAKAVVAALGGRLDGDQYAERVEIRLPRR